MFVDEAVVDGGMVEVAVVENVEGEVQGGVMGDEASMKGRGRAEVKQGARTQEKVERTSIRRDKASVYGRFETRN